MNEKQIATAMKHSMFLPCLLIAVGLVRMTLIVAGDYHYSGAVDEGAQTFRRQLQLVTMGVNTLLARHGFAAGIDQAQEGFAAAVESEAGDFG